jgi:hypothetical protein
MNAERHRLVLTLVWFGGMLASVATSISYMWVTDASNVPLLAWPDVVEVLKSVFVVYASYLGGIIMFWFTKPFKTQRETDRDGIRFWIAFIGASLVNAAYVAWLSAGYWVAGATLNDIVGARNIVIWLSFIVAPANLYFFGMRLSNSG